ncbi:MAG: type II and III secretion system protein [Verrucomicrobia bacterium]|nr:type II and III secretion system protein [Verrucomicrobiota bacterium]
MKTLRLRVVASALLVCAPLILQGQSVNRIAEREAARRQANIPHGEELLARAQAELEQKQFALAHDDFRNALVYLPDSAASARSYRQALDGFCESGTRLAEQRVAEGKYGDAEQVLNEVLSDRYNPNCHEARTLLAHLREPGFINRTMGPKFMTKVEDVKRLLSEADGFYQSGRYDLAMKRYDQVLNLDPYNTAARKGQERIDNTKYQYGKQAYNETRGRAMWQVEKGWEEPVRQYGLNVNPIADAVQKDATGTARINHKLDTIIIPRIEFRDASIREAIDFVRQQAAANDPATEGRRGVDIVLRLHSLGRSTEPAPVTSITEAPAPLAAGETAPPPAAGAGTPQPANAPVPAVPAPAVSPATPALAPVNPAEARITLTLNQIPLGEALRYIASQAGLKVKVEPYAVSIVPLSEQSNELITKEYRVPPGFISTNVNVGASSLSQGAYKTGGTPTGAAGTGGTGTGTQESTGGQLLVNREGAREFLESQGVPFPPGASAHFLPQSSRLIVRNTVDNLELVDALVEQANVSGPKQVEIESKFVEITQNNLKELGFDWLLGQFNIPGTHRVFAGGGVPGNGVPTDAQNYPFVPPNGVPVGQFPVTAGNRSGDLAISANAIDALLLGAGGSAVAPGIFGLSGVFTDPQFQVVIRALNQKKGIDLLSAPRVTTKSGQRAVIEIVREFRYPTQFQPPQIPQTVGAAASGFGSAGGGAVTQIPITPTTPTAFETRNTGVTLEVEPVVGPDGVTIDLNLVPQVVEFEGFINYGSPIYAPSSSNSVLNLLTGIVSSSAQSQQVLTPNIINQPIFSTRKVTTSVSVWDGQTVVLGGLMREDVQKTEDRTPIIGDIPIVGRLFRTNAEQHIKRNLVIFVTARLVNPAGQPVNSTEEEEEQDVVQPPTLPEVPMYKK